MISWYAAGSKSVFIAAPHNGVTTPPNDNAGCRCRGASRGDAHLLALDTRAGSAVWDAFMADYKLGSDAAAAPVVMKAE